MPSAPLRDPLLESRRYQAQVAWTIIVAFGVSVAAFSQILSRPRWSSSEGTPFSSIPSSVPELSATSMAQNSLEVSLQDFEVESSLNRQSSRPSSSVRRPRRQPASSVQPSLQPISSAVVISSGRGTREAEMRWNAAHASE